MTRNDFLRVISYFLQDPDAVVADRGLVAFANGDAEYSIELKTQDGEVSEVLDKDGERYAPIDWISNRLAHVERLAHAILRQFQDETEKTKYVPVESSYQASGSDRQEDVEDTMRALYEQLETSDRLQTSVYFLTSEAGEGKTVIMRRLAVQSAKRFLEGSQNWIFVPIELGGKPFLRLDEFVLGSLNRLYRYSLYLEAFLELVKRGRIVLGLDGFEESAVQGANGDVISSLGSLLSSLDSQGCVVFASRKAFYFHSHLHDYKSFAKLAQTHDVSINVFSVKPWRRVQVVVLAKQYGVSSADADAFYEHLANALQADCPLLTRAVLAHKFIGELVNDNHAGLSMDEIIGRFQCKDTASLVHQFVSYLLERETGKLVRSDTDVTPILSMDGHERVLMSMAEEMWNTDIEMLASDTIDAIVELEAEKDRLSPDERNRCRTHVLHHALLSTCNGESIVFCHLDFYHYFLGASIAETALAGAEAAFELHKLLDRKPLPVIALKECARRLVSRLGHAEIQDLLRRLNTRTIGVTTLGQNVAALLLLAHKASEMPIELVGLYCPEFVLQAQYLRNVTMRHCVVERCDLALLGKANVFFSGCEFPRADYIGEVNLQGVTFDVESLPRVLVRSHSGEKPDVGDRNIVATLIRRAGATVLPRSDNDDAREYEEDERTQVFFKVIVAFDSTTIISERLLQVRLGSRYALFRNEICELMLEKRVLTEKPSRGRESCRMFRLTMPSDRIAAARDTARGSFECLMKSL